ncbi:hypothetical protein FLONG3_577 [Fusarium longipes]|uniref:DUF4238 domain-containing protein n=1 Tax=Fusarium longipes TaxID=694270 RepID=A0A395TAU3_9HYPO|nr:hypothetical protein FLONG3_577 [Fusarium longipes]
MASHGVQYHHYIPRFILKEFAHTNFETNGGRSDGLLHVFDVPSRQFRLGEVAKTCGAQNLYYNTKDNNPMRIEQLFSKLESKTSSIFAKIKTAVTEGHDHIDILEKDIHILFKFINLSIRRSKQYKDEVNNPYRENDFVFQRLFQTSRKSGRSSEPGQFWLEHLLYLLETDHEDLLADSAKPDNMELQGTYRYLVENYALQIWRAADGYEFFLNERLVDFEGDTQSVLGTEMVETRMQLIWMTTEDMIHLILPISPEVAIVFCDESRCWESSFADIMHRLKKPYPQNSLLVKAPHKDIIDVCVPRRKRGGKFWPATVAWRVNIGTLTRPHHRIIASYSLSHANSVIIVQNRARFERARRELHMFNKERQEWWQSIGIRSAYRDDSRQCREGVIDSREDYMNRIVDEHITALDEVVKIIENTHERLQRTKENALKSWLAIGAVEAIRISSSSSDDKSSFSVMQPALKATFEDAYPPKHPDHRDLVTITFNEFFSHALGDEMFAKLSVEIEKKIRELIRTNMFQFHFEKFKEYSGPSEDSLLEERDGDFNEQSINHKDILESPSFGSVFRAAQGFDALKWMFEERQDILATFIKQIAVPVEAIQPQVVRIRARRE